MHAFLNTAARNSLQSASSVSASSLQSGIGDAKTGLFILLGTAKFGTVNDWSLILAVAVMVLREQDCWDDVGHLFSSFLASFAHSLAEYPIAPHHMQKANTPALQSTLNATIVVPTITIIKQIAATRSNFSDDFIILLAIVTINVPRFLRLWFGGFVGHRSGIMDS